MANQSVLKYVAAHLNELDGGATYIGTYGSIPTNGLFTAQLTNRPSKSWPKAQFLFTSVESQGHTLQECIDRWKIMCGGYDNQYLIIKDENGADRLYDFKGNLIAQTPVIEDAIARIAHIKNIDSKDTGINASYLRAMRTKPFLLLAGISGTGKSRIVKQMAFDSCPNIPELRSDHTSPGNYCLIEVKPNWHDSTELLGYESRIGGAHYQLTPFVKFLIKAMHYPTVPFFVCLDEMNLAPVEQYFAEFLSVLESRTKTETSPNEYHITSDPLIRAEIFAKKEYELNLQDELFSLELKEEVLEDGKQRIITGHLPEQSRKIYNILKKHGLHIPENVIVIGTVNMDETTHQFSRKVIDRAMTIEMNLSGQAPFMDFFNKPSVLAYRANPTPASYYLSSETKASDIILVLSAENAIKTELLKQQVAQFLTELNEALDGTPFKIAYRVQNELMLYFYQLWREDRTADWNSILNTAADQILMMKVLPRIEGDDELLETPLEKLLKFCAQYPNAHGKIEEMKSRLDKSRFTSYWP